MFKVIPSIFLNSIPKWTVLIFIFMWFVLNTFVSSSTSYIICYTNIYFAIYCIYVFIYYIIFLHYPNLSFNDIGLFSSALGMFICIRELTFNPKSEAKLLMFFVALSKLRISLSCCASRSAIFPP